MVNGRHLVCGKRNAFFVQKTVDLLKLRCVVIADAHSCGQAHVHGFLQTVSQCCLLEEGERKMDLDNMTNLQQDCRLHRRLHCEAC